MSISLQYQNEAVISGGYVPGSGVATIGVTAIAR